MSELSKLWEQIWPRRHELMVDHGLPLLIAIGTALIGVESLSMSRPVAILVVIVIWLLFTQRRLEKQRQKPLPPSDAQLILDEVPTIPSVRASYDDWSEWVLQIQALFIGMDVPGEFQRLNGLLEEASLVNRPRVASRYLRGLADRLKREANAIQPKE